MPKMELIVPVHGSPMQHPAETWASRKPSRFMKAREDTLVLTCRSQSFSLSLAWFRNELLGDQFAKEFQKLLRLLSRVGATPESAGLKIGTINLFPV